MNHPIPIPSDVLDELVASVRANASYATLDEALIRTVGADELRKGRRLREAVKETRSKLHQVASAYLAGMPSYNAWQEEMRDMDDDDSLREFCQSIMVTHISTRERLPILDTFYTTLFAGMPAPQRVLDVACGLNPLAWSWMGLPASVQYTAYDVYADMTGFLNAFFRQQGLNAAQAVTRDVLGNPPTEPVDLALLLKAIPCLEQLDKDAGRILLDSLRARWLIVSFPVQSLGGRGKGMIAHYGAHFESLIAGRGWQVERFEFRTELVFRVQTGADTTSFPQPLSS